jgi:hypothetical protein
VPNEWRVLLASVKEVAQALQESNDRGNVEDALFWRAVLSERVEVLIATVRSDSSVTRTDIDE